MKLSNTRNDGAKPVVVDFQNYASRKLGFKRSCKGCLYLFSPKNNSDCFCDQCSAGRRVYGNLKATQAMLNAGGGHGYH